jgi:metal-dependent amidase/aminoacylase/carboxypeptidase family protein
MIMGLHNIPGFPKGQLLFSKDTFADASEGLTIRLTGQQSHAGYPGQGANPAFAAAEVIHKIPDILKMNYKGFVLITVVSVNVGEKNFGISAGEAEICLTLRSEKSDDLVTLENNVLECAKDACIKHPGYSILEYKRNRGTFVKHGIGTKSHPAADLISMDFSRQDVFPGTENTPEDSFNFKNSMEDKGYNCRWLAEPMRWSEDFGHYRNCTRSFFFGLGSGEECPGLHTESYIFPEDLLETGARVWIDMIASAIS